jgi:hypothetical protein
MSRLSSYLQSFTSFCLGRNEGRHNFHVVVFIVSADILGTFRKAPPYLLATGAVHNKSEGVNMNGELTGLVAVIMIFGIPLAAMYTFYHVRKLRTDERLAAIARGVNVPMEPELPHAARSRRNGILLVFGGLGYMATFALIAKVEPDAWVAAAFGIIPLALGLGCFLDFALLRRDLRAT